MDIEYIYLSKTLPNIIVFTKTVKVNLDTSPFWIFRIFLKFLKKHCYTIFYSFLFFVFFSVNTLKLWKRILSSVETSFYIKVYIVVHLYAQSQLCIFCNFLVSFNYLWFFLVRLFWKTSHYNFPTDIQKRF